MHAPGLRLRRARHVLAIERTIDIAFRNLNNVGTRDETVYGAQYWACMYPCRCHTQRVTTIGVRLGASVSGKDFAVRLFHSQLQAGLSRRFLRSSFSFFVSARGGLELVLTSDQLLFQLLDRAAQLPRCGKSQFNSPRQVSHARGTS